MVVALADADSVVARTAAVSNDESFCMLDPFLFFALLLIFWGLRLDAKSAYGF
jgi:hypothetical protein